MSREFNFDGLIGPTHNYGITAYGNVASINNVGNVSNPKKAAKEGLAKMQALMRLGIPQAVLPPHYRPNFELLRSLGFSSLDKAYKHDLKIFAAIFSASSMWAANAATVSPSVNTTDKLLHITPANLVANIHRAQEANFNYILFSKIFADQTHFKIHEPLPGQDSLNDEGAANHSNFCLDYASPGMEMYVYGRSDQYKVFNGRQTAKASEQIAYSHNLKQKCLLVRQDPKVIDAGVFHNDVICVVNKNVVFYHADAFIDWPMHKNKISSFFDNDCYFIEIPKSMLSVHDAVETYIFNAQLVSLDETQMALIVPMECKHESAQNVLEYVLKSDNPITKVEYVECRQSMLNGGGPACLRLRIVMNSVEARACHQGVIMHTDLYARLVRWVDKHYRDQLSIKDLLDPDLILEVNTALDELTQILQLGSIYSFQC